MSINVDYFVRKSLFFYFLGLLATFEPHSHMSADSNCERGILSLLASSLYNNTVRATNTHDDTRTGVTDQVEDRGKVGF